MNFIFFHYVIHILLLRCHDIETNPGPNNPTELSIYCSNIRSLLAVVTEKPRVQKIDHLIAELSASNHSIVLISWLRENDPDKSISIPQYTQYRRERLTNRYGGLVTYIHTTLASKRIVEYEPADSEIMCHEIVCTPRKLLICSCYRPQTRCPIDFLTDIKGIINAANQLYDGLIFIGDMNCKHSDFYENDQTCNAGRQFKAFFESHSFEQLIHKPTRFSADNRTYSCIDLIFTNIPHIFTHVGTETRLPNCDHAPITALLNIPHKRGNCFTRQVWDFKNGNFVKFRELLAAAPWGNVSLQPSVNESALVWSDMFMKIAESCIPHNIVTIRPNDKPWMTSEIRRLIRKRQKLFKRRNNSAVDRDNYNRMRNNIVTLIRLAKLSYELKRENIVSNPTLNVKQWWKIIKYEIKGSQQSGIPFLESGGMTVVDDCQKANLLNNYFVEQSTVDDDNMILPDIPILNYPQIDDIVINKNDVYKLLCNLDVNKATGNDQIGNKLLKEAAPSISKILSKIFNTSIQN